MVNFDKNCRFVPGMLRRLHNPVSGRGENWAFWLTNRSGAMYT